jgi:hypothetical protein
MHVSGALSVRGEQIVRQSDGVPCLAYAVYDSEDRLVHAAVCDADEADRIEREVRDGAVHSEH